MKHSSGFVLYRFNVLFYNKASMEIKKKKWWKRKFIEVVLKSFNSIRYQRGMKNENSKQAMMTDDSHVT